MEDLQLLTAGEVARLLRVSPSTVFKWSKSGIIPSYRLHQKSLRFKREDITTFVERGKGVTLIYRKNRYR